MNVQPIKSVREGDASDTNFAATLRELMLAKRISASDLAREIWGVAKDKRGYEVARNRDRIGHYLSGKSFPTRDNLVKMAKALSVKLEVLEKIQPAPTVRETKAPKDIEVVFYTDGPLNGSALLSMIKVSLSRKSVLTIMDIVAADPIHNVLLSAPHHGTPARKAKNSK